MMVLSIGRNNTVEEEETNHALMEISSNNEGPQKPETSVSDDQTSVVNLLNISTLNEKSKGLPIDKGKIWNRNDGSRTRRKKMAREGELKKQRVINTVPVQLYAVRSNVNTVRANVNSVRQNVNSGTAVKTSAGYNWRKTRPNSNYNSGSKFVRTVNSKGPQGRPKPEKAWHKVLFTETECLVVSPNFKMPDENQILLKVPRQHNMYSFDMKTPSLTKDYACLIAKATSDESKLWHRSNGTEFKNRTLIEAARTMLSRLTLPKLLFVAEVVYCHALSSIGKNQCERELVVEISKGLKWPKVKTGRGVLTMMRFLPPVARIEAISDEEVYVSQPPSFVDPDHPKKVYKHGYMRGTIDKTLFIKKDKKDIMLVQVYVDDIIFGSTRKSWCDEFKALMKGRYQISSMGELIFFLGLQVKQKTYGIFISQDKYVADMLKKFDLTSVKTAITPMETKMALTKDEEADEVDVTYTDSHVRESSFDLEAFSDSDYAGANLDRKSTTGGCQFLGSRLISWQCKKQTIVATSTTEAEYVAAASCCGQDSRTKSTIDTLEYTITEASVRSKLQLADASGISMLPNTEIFEEMGNMGYPADEMIFEIQTENKHPYLAIVLTKKIFGNMKRGFRGVPRPLLPAMFPVVAVDQSVGQADQAVDQPSPSEPLPSSSHPPVISATTESEPTPIAEPTPHPKLP
ncbi:putative ribonuclease H-like domain-containing protein [Tanacetum coccineum]